MIHYHGCPITPQERLYELAGRFFCNSFAHPRQVSTCHEIGQGNMLDNGAYTAWTKGRAPDWAAWAEWAQPWLDFHTTWAVLPDSVDGGAEANDALLREWASAAGSSGAPVWHMDEPLSRLVDLCSRFERVCFGSAGAYRIVGSPEWHRRAAEAFNAITDADGRVSVWIHMLRGMSLSGKHYPFASVDSTDVARNHNRHNGNVRKMADRWDGLQCPAIWERSEAQEELFDLVTTNQPEDL